ncbi:adenosylcobinamide-phosphate synthase [Palleronia marisminoris]|uniref:Cobalamin biosynthesis protein CobD n=1 Tax=Palleronia marisminoris TaxID=315423 RepID=A0A1Y5SNZ4_9RHOB|nr:adenosylcobinamide-phosphate synthase CbiB [Palleronia marisminoris]SFG84740.1 adenosylcobinamide-phosphate synthase [Palleronia marisminoris]SLN42078.1 cobalamin biosynthesis protein [Palleronia marisminoris]
MIGAMAVALALDATIGWPGAVHDRIGHPVTWMGRLIAALDRRWNEGDARARRRTGQMTVAATLAAVLVPAIFLQSAMSDGLTATLVMGVLAWPLVAARSLHDHVKAVALPLTEGDATAAREEVAKIVGRDPSRLDPPGIARAAIESLAENASDGVIAPLFWGALFGLPGIAAYKAINTMDSMIGHRTPAYEDFGRAAARLDDLANWIPARLTGALFCLVAPAPKGAFAVMRRDARRHRSPNAGWPEAAMAAALGCRLSGPRVYADRVADEPWLNAGAPDATADALSRALDLYRRAMLIAGAVLVAVWIA